MFLMNILKRALAAVSWRNGSAVKTAPPQTAPEAFNPLSEDGKKLMLIIGAEVRKNMDPPADGSDAPVHDVFIEQYKSMIASYRYKVLALSSDVISALLRAASEHDDFHVTYLMAKMGHVDEAEMIHRSLFHSVLRDYPLSGYYIVEVLERMSVTDERFTSCTYSELDEETMKQSLALFRVVAHFIQYRGFPSKDTSTFLREEPEMADKVIEYIERRGVGMNGFDMELFKMSRETTLPILDSGVL